MKGILVFIFQCFIIILIIIIYHLDKLLKLFEPLSQELSEFNCGKEYFDNGAFFNYRIMWLLPSKSIHFNTIHSLSETPVRNFWYSKQYIPSHQTKKKLRRKIVQIITAFMVLLRFSSYTFSLLLIWFIY